MEVGQGPNWGCNAKEKKLKFAQVVGLCDIEINKKTLTCSL
jgi:hypothetical protein